MKRLYRIKKTKYNSNYSGWMDIYYIYSRPKWWPFWTFRTSMDDADSVQSWIERDMELKEPPVETIIE